MPEGFYARTELEVFETKVADTIPKCGACGLYKGCHSPKMPPAGDFGRRILVVGEAPGEMEDRKNRPFVGKAGQELRRHLAAVGHDLFSEAVVTNTIVCRPPGNETPTDKQISYCRPTVFNLIREYDPTVIVLLGGPAVQSVVGELWNKSPGPIGRWAGFRIPAQAVNAWVCPTWHPSYVMREDSPVLSLLFRKHLKAAFSINRRPWKKVPDYAGRVACYEDGDEAAKPLRQLLYKRGNVVAWDYETNMLKPDRRRSKIVCCAASDGRQCVSFMWNGDAVGVMQNWLASPRPKVAANAGFEMRWSYKEFGSWPNGVIEDVNLQAHVRDNRPLVTGVKFQAFASLGYAHIDRYVDPFLKVKNGGGYDENKAGKCPAKDLLTYCGVDAVVEALLFRVHDRRF